MCSLFTGCALVDIKDKGGMENPDVVSREEETGTDGDKARGNINRFMKRRRGRVRLELHADSDQLIRETPGSEMQKTVSGAPG